MVYEVRAASVDWNPSAERLRELTEKMPNCQVTEFGNVVVKARVDSRSTRSTFIVDDSTNATKQTITREEYDRIAAEQDAYVAGQHMLVVDGYIGTDPQFRTRARLIIEKANANVAGMQQQLYYPVRRGLRPAAGSRTPPSSTRRTCRPPATPTTAHRRRPRQHHPRPQLRLLR